MPVCRRHVITSHHHKHHAEYEQHDEGQHELTIEFGTRGRFDLIPDFLRANVAAVAGIVS